MTSCARADMTTTFSQRLIEAAQHYYVLVDTNDVEGILALFTTDAVYHRPGYGPMVGRSQIEEFYRSQRVIERASHRLAEVVASGSMVAVHGQCAAHLKDGRDVDLRFADFFVADETGAFRRRDTFFFAPLV